MSDDANKPILTTHPSLDADRQLSDAEVDSVSGGWNFGTTTGSVQKNNMKTVTKETDAVRTLLSHGVPPRADSIGALPRFEEDGDVR